MGFLAETWCVEVLCISKILALVTFGPVYNKAHFRPNRKFYDSVPVQGWKSVTALSWPTYLSKQVQANRIVMQKPEVEYLCLDKRVAPWKAAVCKNRSVLLVFN